MPVPSEKKIIYAYHKTADIPIFFNHDINYSDGYRLHSSGILMMTN